jgi:hypothetical protein
MALFTNANARRIEQTEKELEELEALPQEIPGDKEVLSPEEKTFKKRYSDLRAHSAKKEKELQDRIETLENQLKAGKTFTPPKSDEEIEDWIKKYPDVAGIVRTLAAKEAEARLKDTESRIRDLDKDREEIRREKALKQIQDAHPDFEALNDSDEFHDWAEQQPKWVQTALYEDSEDPKAVIRAIDLYKLDKAPKSRKDKEAAAFVKPGSKSQVDADGSGYLFSESQIAKMSQREYDKNEEVIEKAIREGKFLYDLTGAAR